MHFFIFLCDDKPQHGIKDDNNKATNEFSWASQDNRIIISTVWVPEVIEQ